LNENGLAFEIESDDDFSIYYDGFKIVFYRKDRGLNPTALVEHRTLSETDLVDRLIGDFTKMTYGLLSNGALSSLGALRNNTHKILRKFERELDAPYLTHRAMVTPAHEAQQHLVPLLTSEFHDILEDCGVDENVSIEKIEKWLDYKITKGDLILEGKEFGMNDFEIKTAIINLVKNGIDAEIYVLDQNKNKFSAWRKKLEAASKGDSESFITTLLVNKELKKNQQDFDFAILTIMRSQYRKPDPILALGTIISKVEEEKDYYYICIQPLCDSVRLEKDTIFPFLKLNVSTSEFDIVISDKNDYKKLKISLKPRDIILFNLKQEGSEIRAKKNSSDGYEFETVGDESNIRWIGNLKFAHAQRVANDFAREISRVGLTESDWLRRMKPKQK